MSQLDDLVVQLAPLGELFRDAGYSLYLVGGIVRDAVLDILPPQGDPRAGDYDLTTDALPDQILELVRPLATALWTQGERFGTIGATVDGRPLEITTHRAEVYDDASRKPMVTFGTDLTVDLSRRDFSINAMAVGLPTGTLFDPYGGAADLEARVLRTPLDPRISFTDDPLRMMRAARFIPRFGLSVDPDLTAATVELRERIQIVSVERVHDELERLLGVDDPSAGLRFAVETGLLALVLEVDEADARLAAGVTAAPDGAGLLERRSLLLSPFGTDGAAAILRRLRYSNDSRDATLRVLRLQDLFEASGEPSLPTVRRALDQSGGDGAEERLGLVRTALVVAKAGPTGESDRYAAFGELLEVVASTEDVGSFEGPLNGQELMKLFDLDPGPTIGKLTKVQRELRYEHGVVSHAQAEAALREWLTGEG